MSETSVERAFAILETFEREGRPLSLKELAKLCRIPASTCHTLVHTLLARAYLYQAGRRKDLYPTRRLYDMGTAIMASDPVLQRLLPILQDLRDATRETVILGKRHKDSVVYLEVIEGPEVIRYSARPGDVKPLPSTCIGKTMLAALDPEDAREWLLDHPPVSVTGNTITAIDDLLEDLQQGRERGVFATRGENVPDVTALAVPVPLNNELYAIAIAGPSHRLDARFTQVSNLLRQAQVDILEGEIVLHG